MKSSRALWRIAGLLSLLATVLFASGFVYAIKDILHPQPSDFAISPPEKEQPGNALLKADQIRIVALGDSLTRGTGDETGKGYVGRVKDYLAQTMKKPVYVIANYSVNGYTTKQLLNDIETKSEVPNSISNADVIMLSIGGNDLFSFATEGGNPLENGHAEVDPQAVEQHMPEALTRLDRILSKIADLNPKAAILYVGLYNPFKDIDNTGKGSLAVDHWNRGAFEIANRYPNMTVVPTYDLFSQNLLKYLYSDHFHPNQDGYQRIADRMIQVLE